MEIGLIVTILGIHLLAVISPGPDLVMAIRNSLTYSRKTGMWTALGFGLGIAVHVTYSLFGLALLISKSIILFSVIKYIGAAYLTYIGIKSLLAKRREDVTYTQEEKEDISAVAAIKMGFLTNVLNPKATLFFLSLFTMIISPESSKISIGVASAAMVVNTTLWFSFVAVVFTHPKTRSIYDRFKNVINKSFGVILIALGIKVALSSK